MSKLGKYAEGYGKKALILISQSGYKRIGGRVETGFAETGCSTVFDYFNGECCKTEINRLIGVMEKEGCDLVIGIGGGKILDTAKAVAYYRHTPVVICPTIASTDAPCSALSVIYTEKGVFEEYLFLPSNPDMVLMDTEVIAQSPGKAYCFRYGRCACHIFRGPAPYWQRMPSLVREDMEHWRPTLWQSCVLIP